MLQSGSERRGRDGEGEGGERELLLEMERDEDLTPKNLVM
jgi:hypothetical protein